MTRFLDDVSATTVPAPVAKTLAAFAAKMDSALVVGDADGCVRWVNEAFTRLAGVEASEIVGQRLALHPEDPDAEAALVARVRSALDRGEIARLEISVRARDQRSLRLALEVHAVPAEDGAPAGFVARASDVTEAHRAQSALVESEERYRTLVELSPEPIAVHCNERVVFVNAAALQLLGARESAEIVGRPILELVHPDFHGVVSERVLKMEASGEPVMLLAEKLVRVDGRAIEVELAAAPVLWDGERAIQIVARDVTERRRVDEERRALESKLQQAQRQESLTALASGIAHDFGGLLATILGDADLALLEMPDDAPAAAPVREIRTAALRAAALTSQMLAFAGQPKGPSGPLDLSRLVLELSQRIDNAVSRSASVSYDLLGSLPPVDGDAAQLRQVVTTLLLNASESLRDTRGTLAVRTDVRVLDAEEIARFTGAEGIAAGRFVTLEVTDSGCGMDAATQSRIFDPFFTTKFPGRGLGLAAAFGIVRAHGGALRVESEVGRGTRVTLVLPALAKTARIVSSRASGSAKTVRRRALGGGRPLVLVVDDESGMRGMARRALERAGFDVLLAGDGLEAIEIFRAQPDRIAAVLLDLTMPRMTGDVALRELALIRPDVRVVLSSAYAGAEVLERLRSLPVAAFLKKPYDAASLVELVTAVVAGEL